MVGGEEDGASGSDDTPQEKLYTTPEDMVEVYRALSAVGGRFLFAATFGNVHGVYKPGNVKLKPDVLAEGQRVAAAKLGLALGSQPFDFVSDTFHNGCVWAGGARRPLGRCAARTGGPGWARWPWWAW